ncbi:unnamed protein product [Fusarium graminearum]|uniref:Uncharacterized protein n=1 Tax=Gibberella zeae TaxID=5518 RepID=A0A9N8NC74_GIBZA|nr:unnamed protein product [Fusarium graminearum]
MDKYPLKKLSSEVEQLQKGLAHLVGSVDDHEHLIKTVGSLKRNLEITFWFHCTFDKLRLEILDANHTNRLRNLFLFIYQETGIKADGEEQLKRNRVLRSELKKFGLIELVFLGITCSVVQVKRLTDDDIKFIHNFLRQSIKTNRLEPYLHQERFVTAIKKALVIDLVERDFSDFPKFKKDIEAQGYKCASKKRKKVSDNDPAGESLRASSISADAADDDINLESHGLDTSVTEPTCCFSEFIPSLVSAEDEEISSASRLPQVQAHVQQPAIDESRTEKDRSEENSHPTTGFGTEAHAEVSIAQNIGGSLHPEREVETSYEKCVIDVNAALSYLKRKSNSVWWTATFVRLVSKQFSCLVFFPREEEELRQIPTKGIFILQRFFTWTNKATDIQWRDIPNEAPRVSKDSRQSLERVTGTVGSNLAYAGLAFMPGDTVDVRLILYHDMIMSEALAQLPEIPMLS